MEVKFKKKKKQFDDLTRCGQGVRDEIYKRRSEK